MSCLWRVAVDRGIRLAVGDADGPSALLPASETIAGLLAGPRPFRSFQDLPVEPLVSRPDVLPPLDEQEIWAAGVTFQVSRYNRELESNQPDLYRDVYFAERPELFLKGAPGTAVGPGGEVGVRVDSTWDVPEPELVLVIDADGAVVGYTLGNDVSSRSIEGENPLYLPQAKIYEASCAIGPCLVAVEDAPPLSEMTIEVVVHRAGAVAFGGSASLADLRRSPAELAGWLFRARSFPGGVVLLTGTGVVPPPDFTLSAGDVVEIAVPGLGLLRNSVRTVGQRPGGEAATA